MISASHNPIADNGIKFFARRRIQTVGRDRDRDRVAARQSPDLPRPTGADVGVAQTRTKSRATLLRRTLWRRCRSAPACTSCVDAAYGAAYAIAPYALRKLGATVTEINCENDGALHQRRVRSDAISRPLQATVRDAIAAGEERVVGVAFDGDADRALFVDETGEHRQRRSRHVRDRAFSCTSAANSPATRSSER